ncbi:MAG TPA: hypothetical protein VFO44_05885 [Steroidobacteraceae bacterium]|nr:hypothetical protein [Steroidobacteraceae bacterium]
MRSLNNLPLTAKLLLLLAALLLAMTAASVATNPLLHLTPPAGKAALRLALAGVLLGAGATLWLAGTLTAPMSSLIRTLLAIADRRLRAGAAADDTQGGSASAQTAQLRFGDFTALVTAIPLLDAQGRICGSVIERVDRTRELQIEEQVNNLVSGALEGNPGLRLRAASAVEAAALLVSQAIQDSRQPVADLGSALQRMSEAALAQEALTREMAVCIESLQFHDRLVQQLAFARDLLVSVLSQKKPDMASYGATRWNAVLAALRCRPGTHKRRGLSGLPSVAARADHGSCELF